MSNFKNGFTIIELIVSIAIFAFMTAFIIAKYGTFNQNTLLVNMAYDMALTVRTAQSYGLSVKSTGTGNYNAPYGIHFAVGDNTHFKLFADTNLGLGQKKLKYDSAPNDESITTYALTSGATIESICLGSDVSTACTASTGTKLTGSGAFLDVLFKRPNPDAIFCSSNEHDCATAANSSSIATITLVSSDGTNKQVVVIRKNGQISINN